MGTYSFCHNSFASLDQYNICQIILLDCLDKQIGTFYIALPRKICNCM
jgi:hypothetical protein